MFNRLTMYPANALKDSFLSGNPYAGKVASAQLGTWTPQLRMQGFLCFLIVFDEYNLKINWNFNLDVQEKGLCVQCVKKWLTTWFLHVLNYTYMDIWHNIIITYNTYIDKYIYIYTLCVCIRAVTQSKSGSLHVVHAMQAVQVARSMSQSNSARWGHLSVSWRRHSD